MEERRFQEVGLSQIQTSPHNPRKHFELGEQLHGPVPEGMCLLFRDGKQINCMPENLMLITRAELLRLNKHQYREIPDDLKPSVLALAKLEVKTFKLLKNSPGGNP